MTQLLLFDTPAAESFTPISPLVEAQPVAVSEPAATTTTSHRQHERGLNHMGDLARLVLFQYDLVAQRRARRLAKEATTDA